MPSINPGAIIAAASGVAGLAGVGYLGFNSIYSGELGAEHRHAAACLASGRERRLRDQGARDPSTRR